MINIQRLQDTLSNFKSTRIILPPSNKFTQKDAFQMKVDELTNINYNENNDLNDYLVSSNNFKNEIIEEDKNTQNSSNLYSNEDINNIPDKIKLFFDSDEKYYLYGINTDNSFFLSIIFLTQNNFIIKNSKEKNSNMISFKREINLQIDNIYKNNNYKDLKLLNVS